MFKTFGISKLIAGVALCSSVAVGSHYAYKALHKSGQQDPAGITRSPANSMSDSHDESKPRPILNQYQQQSLRKVSKNVLDGNQNQTPEKMALKEILSAANFLKQNGQMKNDPQQKKILLQLKALQQRSNGKLRNSSIQTTLNQLIKALSTAPNLKQAAASSSSAPIVKFLNTAPGGYSPVHGVQVNSGYKNLMFQMMNANLNSPPLRSQTKQTFSASQPMAIAPEPEISSSTATCTTAKVADPTDNNGLNTSDIFTARTANIVTAANQLVSPALAFRFVRDSIGFSGVFGASQSADQVLTSGSGSSADKASLLIALLRAQGIGDHLGEISSQMSLAYQKDHLGSILNSQALSGEPSFQSPLANKIYGAFGESIGTNIEVQSPAVIYGYAGGEFDAESGRYYFRAREYDPSTGRWTANDPIGFKGGSANLYSYSLNDPVNLTDPSGLDVTINITLDPNSFIPIGTISVTSDVGPVQSFSGVVLSTAFAANPNLPLRTPNTYSGKVVYASPETGQPYSIPRIQLNVASSVGSGVQIHNGNTMGQSTGCFMVGTSKTGSASIGSSNSALQSILNIISADGTGNIIININSGIPGPTGSTGIASGYCPSCFANISF